MKIHTVVGNYFIFIAIGMFGAGGMFALGLTNIVYPLYYLFLITSLASVFGLLFYYKELGKAERKLKELEK